MSIFKTNCESNVDRISKYDYSDLQIGKKKELSSFYFTSLSDGFIKLCFLVNFGRFLVNNFACKTF